MAPSIEHLSKYLLASGSTESMVLTTAETEEINEALPWKGQELPWNGRTCVVVLSYVMKFLSDPDITHGRLSDTIRRLEDLASEYVARQWTWSDSESEFSYSGLETGQEIAETYVNTFIPEVQKFFRVPKLHQLSEKDKSRKKNEILAGFMEFLLSILDSEALRDSDDEQRCAPLQKELRFVITCLGDVPFWCTELEQVKNILAEIEIVANETGNFIYRCVFATHSIKTSWFYGGRDSLLGLFGLLIEKIKEHCNEFSELPRCITPKANAIDSLFVVDSLLEDLENVINRRFDLPIDDIKDRIKTIHEEMTFSRSFLKGIEVVQDTNKDELKESSIQIRDVAYEAEYLVNSYVVGNVPLWYVNLRLPTVIQKIKLIAMRLQAIKKIYDMKVLRINKDFDRKLSLQAVKTSVHVDVNDHVVVGFEDEKLKILTNLTTGSKRRQVIFITGMAGLGKTTMAKKLYNDSLSCDYFDERGWCVVSQTYQKRNMLISIFMSLAASKLSKLDKETILKIEDESLALEIYKSLMGRRYLIVMDDVWDSHAWDYLKKYFPDDENGSRIIITSRMTDVAPIGCIPYPLNLLSEGQCWELLEKKVFFEEPCPAHLVCIGKGIAAKCHGLPLAVVVIAGVLGKLEKEESVWGNVERNLDSHMFDEQRGCLNLLELSYEYLPNHLKWCFLYFGAFPEDAEIRTRELIWLWIAEGFIRKEVEKSLENVAEEYLFDLINRSLLMIVKRRYDGGIKTCSIHDLLREMCLRKAHQHNFLKNIKEELSIYEKHQRLCCNSTPSSFGSFSLHCRSFFAELFYPSTGFSRMPLLRVIFLRSWGYKKSKEIYPRVNLRFLSANDLPDPGVLAKLVNLEVLYVNLCFIVELSSILKMVKLRHLRCRDGSSITKNCDTNQKTNLESLGSVIIYDQDEQEILRRSPYLRRLKISCGTTLFPDLHSLTQLESLSLYFDDEFEGDLTKIYFPSTIKKLILSGIGLPWEELSTIGRLPNLHHLRLSRFAFKGKEWITKDGEFQQLRFLRLDDSHLKQWITESGHFPKLQSLVLSWCLGLQEIPDDLGNISTLQTIELSYCSYEANISAVRIELEQRDYGNEELNVIITSNEWSKEQLMRKCEEE